MKTKKLLPILATLVVGATAALSGCTAGNTTIEFKNYWLKNHLTPQNSFTETLKYDVKFEKAAGYDDISYNYEYTDGEYVATLTQFSNDQFEYKTKLTVNVTFSPKGAGESISVTDIVESSVLFQTASKHLAPIQSSKTVLSHFPMNITKDAELEDCYRKFNYTVSTSYTEGKGVCTYQDLIPEENGAVSEPKILKVDMGEKLTYLDNEQLLLAMRAFDPTVNSGNVHSYSPYAKTTQKIAYSFKAEEEASAELSIAENGAEATKKKFKYRVATLSIKAANSGQAQTAWVATENRNLILRLETPFSFNHGKLVYTLKSIDRIED